MGAQDRTSGLHLTTLPLVSLSLLQDTKQFQDTRIIFMVRDSNQQMRLHSSYVQATLPDGCGCQGKGSLIATLRLARTAASWPSPSYTQVTSKLHYKQVTSKLHYIQVSSESHLSHTLATLHSSFVQATLHSSYEGSKKGVDARARAA